MNGEEPGSRLAMLEAVIAAGIDESNAVLDAMDEVEKIKSKTVDVLPSITRGEAQKRVERVRRKADSLWRDLYSLYYDGVHTALGYTSWAAFFRAEFGQSGKRGEQLLRAGRVLAVIEDVNRVLTSEDTTVPSPVNEAQARELAPLLNEPDRLRSVWTELLKSDPSPTATRIRKAVGKIRGAQVPATSKRSSVRLREALHPLTGYRRGWTENALYGMTPSEARRLLREVQKLDQWLLELERALEERSLVSRALS